MTFIRRFYASTEGLTICIVAYLFAAYGVDTFARGAEVAPGPLTALIAAGGIVFAGLGVTLWGDAAQRVSEAIADSTSRAAFRMLPENDPAGATS